MLLAGFPLPTLAAESIKIGMVVPLTGPIADAGRYGTQGAKLAVEGINAQGGVLGRPLELIIEDDQTQNPTTVLAFTKLADNIVKNSRGDIVVEQRIDFNDLRPISGAMPIILTALRLPRQTAEFQRS